jgi:5-methylthioadenosine/S-adenosylhomocysteine deaminase
MVSRKRRCYNPAMDLVITDLPYVVTAGGVMEGCTVTVRDRRVESILPNGTGASGMPFREETRVIDGSGFCALGGMKNAHTHAAMTLLRGYGDDMRLQEWLGERIWPAEAALAEDDIYWGTRLAALEMIKSGTTFANDMYFFFPQAWRAFSDSGIRAAVGLALFDFNDAERRLEAQKTVDRLLQRYVGGGTVFPVIAPHSIYTCSPELLRWSAHRAEELGLVYHIHMSETEREVSDCMASNGVRPWHWLERIGVLNRVAGHGIAAHGIWMDGAEMDLAREYRITLAHNPGSNMKLASGVFDWQAVRSRNIPVMLAPDGVASNNSLDMFDEMRLAALLQKVHTGDPTRLPASEALALATGEYSDLFAPWGVGGALREGGPADIVLVDLNHPQMTPIHNVESSLVYAANGTMVDTVICDGQVLMTGRHVGEEEEILRKGREHGEALVRRASAPGMS